MFYHLHMAVTRPLKEFHRIRLLQICLRKSAVNGPSMEKVISRDGLILIKSYPTQSLGLTTAG